MIDYLIQVNSKDRLVIYCYSFPQRAIRSRVFNMLLEFVQQICAQLSESLESLALLQSKAARLSGRKDVESKLNERPNAPTMKEKEEKTMRACSQLASALCYTASLVNRELYAVVNGLSCFDDDWEDILTISETIWDEPSRHLHLYLTSEPIAAMEGALKQFDPLILDKKDSIDRTILELYIDKRIKNTDLRGIKQILKDGIKYALLSSSSRRSFGQSVALMPQYIRSQLS